MGVQGYTPIWGSPLRQNIHPEDIPLKGIEEDNVRHGRRLQWRFWCAMICPAAITAIALILVCLVLSLPVSQRSGIATVKLSPLASLPISIQSGIGSASSAVSGAIPTIASAAGAVETVISAGEPSIPVKRSQGLNISVSLGTKQACYEHVDNSQCQKLPVNLVDFIPGGSALFGSSLEKLQDVEDLLVHGCLGSIYYALPIGLICMCLSVGAIFVVERNVLVMDQMWRAAFLLSPAVTAFICILIPTVLVSQFFSTLHSVISELGDFAGQVVRGDVFVFCLLILGCSSLVLLTAASLLTLQL